MPGHAGLQSDLGVKVDVADEDYEKAVELMNALSTDGPKAKHAVAPTTKRAEWSAKRSYPVLCLKTSRVLPAK